MKISGDIVKETRHIAIGEVIGLGLMFLGFGLFHRLDHTVILGGLLGGVYAVLNFLFMGITMQKAMDDREHSKAIVQRSYGFRRLVLVVLLAVAFLLPWFHGVAAVIPVFFPQLTILAMRLLGFYQPEQKGGEE